MINRVWAMPNKWTYEIKPIADLIYKYAKTGEGWVDPFCGSSRYAEVRNDINPQITDCTHLDAQTFAEGLELEYDGILFDPPYSLEQCKRSYEDIGRKFTMTDGQICGRWSQLKHILSRKIRVNGYAICFGWNSEGFGKGRGFELEEILLVAHGSGHNDTIVTVERKVQSTF